MTIVNVDELKSGCVLESDVCIIGAGAVGISITREFFGTAIKVILLESGFLHSDARTQTLYESEISGRRHTGIHEGRARRFGGTTTLWGGQALPLLPIDFERRDWVPFSGWPITGSVLAPYYERAETIVQVRHVDYGLASWPKPDLPPYEPDRIASYYSQFTNVPDFAAKYGAALRSTDNVMTVCGANVVSLDPTEYANQVAEAHIASLNGTTGIVRSRYYVVCCGGIETARILLLSRTAEPEGIGNRRGVVGRYFQDHPTFAVPVESPNRKLLQRWCNSFRSEGLRHTIKMVASPSLQRAQRILNVGAEVYYPIDSEGPLQAAKKLLAAGPKSIFSAENRVLLSRVTRNPGKLGAAAWRHYVLNRPASVGHARPEIAFYTEQEPNPESRITLSVEKDALGLQRTKLNWIVSSMEAKSAGVFAEVVLSEWRRLGIGKFDLSPLASAEHLLAARGGFWDNSHHIGTTRMGASTATSVVDENCLVHGYGNLYIGGSSVFPTSGFSNPTLTAIALGLRLADKIKLQLAHRPAN